MTTEGTASAGLDDDMEELPDSFGTLSFTEENLKGVRRDPSNSNLTVPLAVGSGRPGPTGVAFEVVNANIVKESRTKYVVYTVLVMKSTHLDNTPEVVDKRYSDFANFNNNLKRKYPEIMECIAFPSKKVTGNFKAATIAERSRGFEQYLAHIFSIDVIRTSQDFSDFFYGEESKKGYSFIRNAEYPEAIVLMNHVYKLQKKLFGDSHPEVISTVCAIVAAFNASEKDRQAQEYSELALKSIGEDNSNKHLVPLLQLSIRLCWKLGKDKKDLEGRLQELKSKGIRVNDAPSLLEIVVNKIT